MELPVELRLAVEQKAAGIALKALSASAEKISERYRGESGRGSRLVLTDSEAAAYAAARMPATYGAASAVFAQLRDLLPEGADVRTLIDVGAGTGTASWAAADCFSLENILCLEREDCMRALGCELSRSSADPALNGSVWQPFNLVADAMPRRADLVVASYMLNELTDDARIPALMKLWDAALQYLVILEPGTPEGYRQLMAERDALLWAGAYVLAPCAQQGACPLPEGDRCHFACRVSRSRLQKTLKGGDAPYEDEKYGYMIFARQAPQRSVQRVLRHPQVESGRITLSLCTAEGRQTLIVRKKDAAFKQARKAKWGDAWLADSE